MKISEVRNHSGIPERSGDCLQENQSIPEWVFTAPEVRSGQGLQQKVRMLGFSWAVFCGSIALIIHSYLFLVRAGGGAESNLVYVSESVFWIPFVLLTMIVALGVSGFHRGQRRISGVTGFLMALLMAVFWLSLAGFAEFIWQIPYGANNVLLLGALGVVSSFFSTLSIFAIAITPILVGYLYFFPGNEIAWRADLVLSAGVVPFFILSVAWGLNRMYRLVLVKNDQSLTYHRTILQINHIDTLTGLANRQGFDTALEQAIHLSERFNSSLSVVVAGIDNFSVPSDLSGKDDEVECKLKSVAELLSHQAVRAVDWVAYTGNGRFALILPGCDQDQAVMLVRKIQQALERLIESDQLPWSDLTLSYGVAMYGQDSPESLYNKASQMLERAQASDNNQIEVLMTVV